MNPSTKSKLLRLTRQKDSTAIKSFLESSPKEIKGKLFEQYLAELYRGNGWLVEIKAGRGDLGADILLYHPKTPSRVSLITQAKNHAKPLTFDQTKIELVKFEEQAAPKYNCQQFNLVAVNGFARTAEQLGEFNMLLYAWDYVAGLIERYDPDHKTEPEIELYAHNKITYERCKELWQESNYVAVVQATGTGKSYIIAKVMADFLGSKKLVMAPSNYILEQQRSKVSWASESTIYMTYARGANLTDKEIQDLGVKLIVLDEFHRCGAEMWGAGVEKILNTYPDSYVFGTTATPIRYLDANRDMSDEIFDGVVAENLPLAKAIVRKILPAPTYVAALYTLEEEFEYLEEILAKSKKSEAEKNEIAVEIGRIRFTWEKTSGVPQILKKHLKPETNKFIIFCKDQNHLDQMEVEVQRWFQKLKIHRWRKVYRVLSDDPESDQNLEAFKDSKSKDTVHLLFAIDMLNEGLHIFEVGCVILLRPTESPRIFYQQIGRCMQVNAENAPIIVDLVNNFQSIRADDFLENLNEARDAERKRRADFGLGEYTPEIHITDETKDILEVFEEISERLSAWEVMFQHLCEYVDREGHARVPNSYITSDGFKLGNWVSSRRMDYKKSKLSEDRIRALEELPGWSWDPLEGAVV
jgi:superfamily II DNA or RNA helicase